eukprot:4518190-Pyramimonas_sp.AAC.1
MGMEGTARGAALMYPLSTSRLSAAAACVVGMRLLGAAAAAAADAAARRRAEVWGSLAPTAAAAAAAPPGVAFEQVARWKSSATSLGTPSPVRPMEGSRESTPGAAVSPNCFANCFAPVAEHARDCSSGSAPSVVGPPGSEPEGAQSERGEGRE